MEEPNDQMMDKLVDLVDSDKLMSPEERRALKSQIQIVDDERMPYYMQDDKKIYVDICLNSSGAIRRLNPGQLVEVETNFIAEQVQHMIKKAKTLEKKAALFFKFMEIVSPEECSFYRNLYNGFDQVKTIAGVPIHYNAPQSKEAFIKDVENYGFYIVRPPHRPLLYDDVIKLYDEFDTVTPVPIYIDIFGTKGRKTLKPGVIGYQYMLILKQNSNKNFSARSTFRVNRSNLPAKDTAKKTNRSSYARTPVRLSEIYNLLASVSGTTLAEYNIFMRSSALGRKSLDRILSADGNPLKLHKLKVHETFVNSNADILAAKLKTLGLRIYYSKNPEGRAEFYDDNQITNMNIHGYMIADYPHNRMMYYELFKRYDEFMHKINMPIETYLGEKSDYCWDQVWKEKKKLQKEFGEENITDELLNLLKATCRGHIQKIKIAADTPTGKKYRPRIASDDERTPRKRGRKSKKEKEEMLRLQQLEEEKEASEEEENEVELTEDENDQVEEMEVYEEEPMEEESSMDDSE